MSEQRFIRVHGRVIPLKTAAGVSAGVAGGSAAAYFAAKNSKNMGAKAAVNFAKYANKHSSYTKVIGRGPVGQKFATAGTFLLGDHKMFRNATVQSAIAKHSRTAAIVGGAVAVGSLAYGIAAYRNAGKSKR